MKKLLVISCIVIPAFLHSQNNNDKYGPRPFNYGILKALKDSGSYDANHQKAGLWVEYFCDSLNMLATTISNDKDRNIYPPYGVVLFKQTGRYVGGMREGKWITYKSYNSYTPIKWDLQETGIITGNKYDGPWKYYYTSGKVAIETSYKDNVENGIHKNYYPNGILSDVIGYTNGVPDSIKHFNKSGILIDEFKLIKGIPEGEALHYYSNGKLQSQLLYKNGLPWTSIGAYDRDGKPLAKGSLKKGNGTLIKYNEMGYVTKTIEYKHGLQNGMSRAYFQNGNIQSEHLFKNGVQDGIQKYYYVKGGLCSESVIENGMVKGSMKIYYPNGKLWTEQIYVDGDLWNVKTLLDTAGKPMDHGTFSNGYGVLKLYSDSCRLLNSYSYKYGNVSGESKGYYPDGKTLYRNMYYNKNIDGTQFDFYESGKIMLETEFVFGEKQGSCKEYHENGKLFTETYYYHGLPWNIVSIVDSNGVVLDAGTFKDGTGILKVYTVDGKLYSSTTYLYGIKNGETLIYYPNGQVRQQLTYQNGLLEGTQKLFLENGSLESESNLEDGLYQGYSVIYHDNGEMWIKRFYIDNYLYEVEFNHDRNGKERDKGTLKKGNGTMLRYDENEKMIFVYEYQNGWSLNSTGDEESYRLGK
jgi:antitoxin component YwqK of YwqJK toxin-antitoxin module